jgi:hypothetical protein
LRGIELTLSDVIRWVKDAALLTLDAAMVLVDEALAAAGSQRACTRAEAQLAFQYLTNPIMGQAVWTDAAQSAIVVTSPSS